jgi:hypothetical protein
MYISSYHFNHAVVRLLSIFKQYTFHGISDQSHKSQLFFVLTSFVVTSILMKLITKVYEYRRFIKVMHDFNEFPLNFTSFPNLPTINKSL